MTRLASALDRDRISSLGKDLGRSLQAVVDSLGAAAEGSGALATATGTQAAFASRLLKALRQEEPLAVLFLLPGPAPLRRFLAGARADGVPAFACAAAEQQVERFDRCIREEAGDRSALHAAITDWLPSSAQDFTAARKQEIFRAWSQLKGAAAELTLGTVLLHPGRRAGRLDVLWILGLLGLRRMRAGATVKLITRRMSASAAEERAPDPLALGEFCSAPPAPVVTSRVGETVHYLLGDAGVGIRSAADLLLAEHNRDEIPYGRSAAAPPRRSHVFAEIGTPTRALNFDLLVHHSLYPGQTPELRLYDTVLEGVADVNDPARDVDLLDLPERVEDRGAGCDALRLAGMPKYLPLLEQVCARAGWEPRAFRAWRCRVEFPPYGAQVVLSFAAPVVA